MPRSCGEVLRLSPLASALLGFLLLSSPVHAEKPAVAAPLLKMSHRDEIERAVKLERARFLLDGKLLHQQTRGPKGNDGQWFEGPLESGPHVLSIELVYVVTGALFDYVNGYRFIATGQLHFDAPRGYVVEVETSSVSKLDLTLPWADRFRFLLKALPREVVTGIRTDVRVASPGEPLLQTLSVDAKSATEEQRLRMLEEEAINEVLAAAARAEQQESDAPRGGEGSDPAAGVDSPAAGHSPSAEAAPAPGVDSPGSAAAAACGSVTLQYDHNSWEVTAETKEKLTALMQCFGRRPHHLRLIGHCDDTGELDYNDRLSLQRARAVVAAIKILRIRGNSLRVNLEARGERQPLCQEQTDECRSRNRRVEVVVTELSAPASPTRPPQRTSSAALR